jgi:hypothetical protein
MEGWKGNPRTRIIYARGWLCICTAKLRKQVIVSPCMVVSSYIIHGNLDKLETSFQWQR